MRISDWSSDVCSSDLIAQDRSRGEGRHRDVDRRNCAQDGAAIACGSGAADLGPVARGQRRSSLSRRSDPKREDDRAARSEEHTSELQSLMRISYAVFCLKKKKIAKRIHTRSKQTNK